MTSPIRPSTSFLKFNEKQANTPSLNIKKKQPPTFPNQNPLPLGTIPTSSNQTKSLAERTIKKLTDHDLIKKHWKTAAVVTIIGIGAFLTYSTFFHSPSLPTELPEQLSANGFTQDPDLLLNYAAKNLKSPARKYIQKLTTPSNSFTCSALQCFAAHTYKNLTPSINLAENANCECPEKLPLVVATVVSLGIVLYLLHSNTNLQNKLALEEIERRKLEFKIEGEEKWGQKMNL